MITLRKVLARNGPFQPLWAGSLLEDRFAFHVRVRGPLPARLPAPALIDRAGRCQGDCPHGSRCSRRMVGSSRWGPKPVHCPSPRLVAVVSRGTCLLRRKLFSLCM